MADEGPSTQERGHEQWPQENQEMADSAPMQEAQTADGFTVVERRAGQPKRLPERRGVAGSDSGRSPHATRTRLEQPRMGYGAMPAPQVPSVLQGFIAPSPFDGQWAAQWGGAMGMPGSYSAGASHMPSQHASPFTDGHSSYGVRNKCRASHPAHAHEHATRPAFRPVLLVIA